MFLVLAAFSAHAGLKPIRIDGDIEAVGGALQQSSLAIRGSDTNPLSAIDDGPGILRASGENDATYRQWFGDFDRDAVKDQLIGILSAIAAVTLTLGIFMVLWATSLRSRLKEKTGQLDSETKRRAEAQAQLNAQMTELGRVKNEAKRSAGEESAFIAYINRELRTPLQGILGATELLEKTRLDEVQTRTLSMVRSSAMRLNRMVSDLHDAVGGESGSLRIEPTEFSFSEFSTLMESSLRPYAEERGLNFRFMTEGNERRITADRNRLTQVIVNLGSNAIKYTDQGEVEIILRLDDHTLRVSVKDTGPGIPEDARNRLFHPYYKSKLEGMDISRGIGLGLSIVKSIVDTMGGQVSYDTQPGAGTKFEVVLPITSTPLTDLKPSGDPAKTRSPVQAISGEAGSGRPVASGTKGKSRGKQGAEHKLVPDRAIIAEDEAINRIYLKRVLENAGYDVTQAADGEAALAAATTGSWSFILMDVSMPRMDGLEATRRIRAYHAQHEVRHVPIIALTAHAYAEDRSACANAGMDGFLSKPFTEAALWVEVKRAVALVEASNAEDRVSEDNAGQ